MAKSKKLRGKYRGPKNTGRGKGPKKLVVSNESKFSIANYNKYSNDDWNTNASKRLFMTRIPENDPYLLSRNTLVEAGGDIRYFFGNYNVKIEGQEDREIEFDSIMAVDFGVRVRPVKENISLVFEHRTLGNGTENLDQALGAGKHH